MNCHSLELIVVEFLKQIFFFFGKSSGNIIVQNIIAEYLVFEVRKKRVQLNDPQVMLLRIILCW